MEEKIKVIRDACVRANPSIMELGFGCEVKAQRWGKTEKLFWKKGTVIEPSGIAGKPYVMFAKHDVDFAYHDIEILGRPIRLADVLLVLQDKNFGIVGDTFIHLEIEGWDTYIRSKKNGERDIVQWNLFKNDLREQSEETIDFLFNLLK